MEQAGIPTITLNNFRPHAECVRPPRVVNVNYPFGALWGPPHAPTIQRMLAEDVLRALVDIEIPGTIVELPYSWEESCTYCVLS